MLNPKSLLLLYVILPAFGQSAIPDIFCEVRKPQMENGLEYIRTIVKALSVATKAADLYAPSDSGTSKRKTQEDIVGTFKKKMTDLKRLSNSYKCSAEMVSGYKASKLVFVNLGAETLTETFEVWIGNNRNMITELTSLLDSVAKGDDGKLGQFLDHMTDLELTADNIAKAIPTAALGGFAAITNLPEDEQFGLRPLSDRKATRLNITTKARDELIALIDREFPKARMGFQEDQTMFELAMVLMREQLIGPDGLKPIDSH